MLFYVYHYRIMLDKPETTPLEGFRGRENKSYYLASEAEVGLDLQVLFSTLASWAEGNKTQGL